MAKATSKALVKWDEKLAAKAKAQAAAEVLGAGTSFSIKGGKLALKGANLPGDKAEVIVVASVFENTFRKGKYNPDNPSSPVCFAYLSEADASGVSQTNYVPDTMRPHEKSTEPQAEFCKDCPHNEFGSADVGQGKACRQGRNLMTVLASEDELESAELIKISIPPTSLKGWKGYVNQLNDTLGRPTMSVVTEIKACIQKTYPAVEFKMVSEIDDGDVLQAIEDREGEALKSLTTPYQPKAETEEKPKKSNKVRKF